MSVVDDDTAVLATSEADFEKEIAEYVASAEFEIDTVQAIAETEESTKSLLQALCAQAIWDDVCDESSNNEFDVECQTGFSTAAQVIDATNTWAGLRFQWSRKPPQSQADLSVPNRIPGEGQRYQRLVGLCPHASSGCGCRVTFRLTADSAGGHAMYKRDTCIREHNHTVTASSSLVSEVNGYKMVERMEQLTPDEKCDIMKHARAGLTPASVLRDILFKTYKKMYSERLILNAMRTARAVHSRMLDGDTSMNKFYDELDKVRADGGRWKDSKRGDGSLKTVFIQSKSMRHFAETYFQVVIVDATFGTNKYGLKLVPFVGIDALGTTQLMGTAFLPTENGIEIFEALEFFGLKRAGCTLITDDHSCYPKLAEEAKMNHLLCAYHFKDEILKACSVLTADMRGRIASELNAAIYEDDKFKDCASIETWFAALRAEGIEYPKFVSFIDRFKDKQKKIFGYWTRQFFNADSFASQRIEGLNHALKGKGERKNALARFNMFESYERIKYTVGNIEHKTKLKLQSLATFEWAPFITLKWTANQQLWFAIHDQPGMQPEPVIADGCVVFNFPGHTVTVPQIASDASVSDPSAWPVCSCNEYTSSHIPCPFVVGACQKHYGSWKKVEYLDPRWRLTSHPWHEHYQQATASDSHIPSRESNAADDAMHYDNIYEVCFRETVAPSSHWFGTELRQHIERIITVVKNETDFKTATATLTVLQHKLEQAGPGVARAPRVYNAQVKGADKVGTKRVYKSKSRMHSDTMKSGGQVDETDSGKVGTKRQRHCSAKGDGEAAKRTKTDKGAKQNDAYIRAVIRQNGGLQNGLVVEVEPDETAKRNNDRWYMTITDGRLKNGVTGAQASVSARFMQTNSATVFEGSATTACKVDSILQVVQPAQFFDQAQIRQEQWQNSRLMFKVRYRNSGSCADKWMDATVIEESLMKKWLHKRSREARKLSEHDYAVYPYECYFTTKAALSMQSKLKCTEGKYKGLTFQEIFDKDVSYCIVMLELFAESNSNIRARSPGGIGQFCM